MFLLLTTAARWPCVVALDDEEAPAAMAAPTATLDP
jgi:hypothetical protein